MTWFLAETRLLRSDLLHRWRISWLSFAREWRGGDYDPSAAFGVTFSDGQITVEWVAQKHKHRPSSFVPHTSRFEVKWMTLWLDKVEGTYYNTVVDASLKARAIIQTPAFPKVLTSTLSWKQKKVGKFQPPIANSWIMLGHHKAPQKPTSIFFWNVECHVRRFPCWQIPIS